MRANSLAGYLQHYNGQPNLEESIEGALHLSWIIDRNQRVASAIISFSCIFVAAFSMTWGPISWIYPAEIFPTEIRHRAVALCTAARWCCHVTVALAVPHLCKWKIHPSKCSPLTGEARLTWCCLQYGLSSKEVFLRLGMITTDIETLTATKRIICLVFVRSLCSNSIPAVMIN